MYHKIRVAVVSLVVLSAIMLSSTGTLSYFTDTDSKTNDFAVGNVSTVLSIYSDAFGSSELDVNADEYKLTNNSPKPFYLKATNDGNVSIYQRFRVVIPITLASVVTLNLPTMDNDCVVETASNHTCENADYTVIYNPSVEVENTPTYAEYYIISKSALAVNATTSEWPTEAIEIGDISGVDDSLFTCADSSGNNCVLGINAYSDAIQTTGFADAISAFTNMAETY